MADNTTPAFEGEDLENILFEGNHIEVMVIEGEKVWQRKYYERLEGELDSPTDWTRDDCSMATGGAPTPNALYYRITTTINQSTNARVYLPMAGLGLTDGARYEVQMKHENVSDGRTWLWGMDNNTSVPLNKQFAPNRTDANEGTHTAEFTYSAADDDYFVVQLSGNTSAGFTESIWITNIVIRATLPV